MNTQEIIALTLKLKPHERLQIVDKIHESFDRPDPEIERLWVRRLFGGLQVLTLDAARRIAPMKFSETTDARPL